MPDNRSRILVTGAGGALGRLVVASLVARLGAEPVVALVRRAEAGADFAAQGVEVRSGDYDRPDSLSAAMAGIGRVLLISSNDLEHRQGQHRAVIAAAVQAGVSFIAYTSVLHAPTSPLGLAADHRDTEAALAESGLPHALLRNGWYTENYLGAVAPALAHGVVLGSSGAGRISAAPRADYAEAAAVVMAEGCGGAFELAGDAAFTMAEFAETLAGLAGQAIAYRDLPKAEYEAALLAAGLPAPLAALVADSSAAAAGDVLFDGSRTLSGLIGRPTQPLAETLAAALTSR